MKKETTLPDELARLLLLETDEDVKTEDDSPSLDYRRDIRSILTALYERAPYIYALFKAVPKTEFRIALTEDFSRGDLPDETYTIPEFCARYASFKPKGQIFLISFSVYCTEKEREEMYRKHGEVFCSPEGTALCEVDSEDLDTAVEEIVSEFPNYMMCRCRKAILANEPLTIDEETIARYALTAEDAARLRRIVRRCNTKIVAELRGQYERLAAIDCLKRSRSSEVKQLTPVAMFATGVSSSETARSAEILHHHFDSTARREEPALPEQRNRSSRSRCLRFISATVPATRRNPSYRKCRSYEFRRTSASRAAAVAA